jgi:5-methylcytosine-specific restriction enzyme subunit McrC
VTRYELAEWGRVEGLDLHRDDALALHRSRAVQLTPSLTAPGRFDVTATKYVGVVRSRGCELWVRPKLPVQQLLFLLGYAHDPHGWRDDNPAFEEADNLVDALVRAYVRYAERALARGLLQGYQSVEDAQPAVRGRIREADQLRRRFGLPLPVEVRYDDYTTDIAENQVLRAAARRLLRVPGASRGTSRRLRRLLAVTRDITDLPPTPTRPPIARTRLNRRYFPAVRLAELALRDHSPEFAPGAGQGIAFLFDMNRVFEDFVTAELGAALERHGGHARAQLHTPLDEGARLTIKPDLSLWSAGQCRAVIDLKYKSLADRSPPEGDIYQMLAYCTALQLAEGYLVYAHGQAEPTTYEIRGAGIHIVVATLDLGQPPDLLLAQLARLAERIARRVTDLHETTPSSSVPSASRP